LTGSYTRALRPIPCGRDAAVASGRTTRDRFASRADANAADHRLLLEADPGRERDRAIADSAHPATRARDPAFAQRAHPRVAAAPARRGRLDVQNLDDQRAAALRAADFEWPRHGIYSTNRRARQIDQLADGVDEHGATPRILRLEHHGCTRATDSTGCSVGS
jgi:hypothetical protein